MNGTRPDYRLLAVFSAVAEQANFTRAARKLGMGKATVSRAIAELERQLRTELVHRTTHSVALSTAGVALHERTAQHLAALDQAVLKLPERAAEPSGLLRMSTPPDFGLICLPELLVQFARRYPRIHFEVRVTAGLVDLVGEGFDLAIRAAGGRLEDSTLTARRLGAMGVGLYASPGYVARRGKPKQLGDPSHDWVLHPGAKKLWRLAKETPIRLQCDDMLLARALISAGGGVGLLPQFAAGSHVREGLLEDLTPAEGLPVSGALFLVYPSSGEVPRKVTAFRDFLIETLKKSPLS
jgi:DNA-binding transcriptional LysR family regulator